MRFQYLLPADWPTLLRRYAIVAVIRSLWLLALSFSGWTAMNGLYPQPAIFENFVRIILERPTFIVEGQFFPFVFNVILAALQVGLLIGAVRLTVTAMMSSPDQTGEAAAGIDGRRLRRPWWHTPVAMTFSIIISLYAIVWGVLLLTQRPGTPLQPFGLAFEQAGSVPLYLGLAFGVLGFLWGSRFNASARARIASKAGVHHLADTHWLTQRVLALAARLDLPPPAVGVMNAVNAYASGSSPEDAAVVLGVPLINGLSDDELDAVIGHELGHIVSGDMRQMQYAVGYQRMFGTILGNDLDCGHRGCRASTFGRGALPENMWHRRPLHFRDRLRDDDKGIVTIARILRGRHRRLGVVA